MDTDTLGEGSLSASEPLTLEFAEATPHPALRAIFSHRGRRGSEFAAHTMANRYARFAFTPNAFSRTFGPSFARHASSALLISP